MNVVFFDGYCGVCDAVVSHLVPFANRAGLRFSSLQGETYREVIARHPKLEGVDSVILVEGFADPASEIVSLRSDAVIRIYRRIGGVHSFVGSLLRLIPRFVRDPAYDLFARNRTKFFPARDSCRLPTAEERALFLP